MRYAIKEARRLVVMMILCAVGAVTLRVSNAQEAQHKHNLMPVPASVQFQTGRLKIDASFNAATGGYRDPRLEAAISRAERRLEGRTGLEFKREIKADPASATLVVTCQGPGNAVPSVDEDESYALDVSDKQAILTVPTVVGALRGLETLLQLVQAGPEGYFLPSVTINDKPRFRWRGLLIDVCRHWEPIEVIKRNLDAMAAVKLNVLHWHLSEDQGFRVESRKYPKLQQMGADGFYYTQDQVRDVVAYAGDRGIRIVPEFDMPGHSVSWLVGYPQLSSDLPPGQYQVQRRFGIFDEALDPTRNDVYKFLDQFIGEMASLFPDAYMHIGGDESNGKSWDKNPKIQEFKRKKGIKDNAELQAYFNQRLSKILEKHGKRMVGWDEILHPNLPKNVVVQSWRGQASLAAAAKQGYSGILSSGYYLDHIQPAEYHYAVDPLPAGSGLSDEQARLILGGEACMWGEHVTPETIDSRIWPRLAAIAERLWSPQTVTDMDDMYRRLAVVSLRLEELGLTHESNTGRMLRRLAGNDSIDPLRVLADVVEPATFSGRSSGQRTTQTTPMTRLVDAARPDPPSRREYAAMVDHLLSDAPRFKAYSADLARDFTEWRDKGPALETMMAASPILAEAQPRARELSELGTAGLEALNYLSSNTAPRPGWAEERLKLMDEAAQPKALVRFTIVPAMRLLIVAASEAGKLATTAPEEWKKEVVRLAAEKQKPARTR
jgi:hexosaminidase